MILHEAIVDILKEAGKPLSTLEITERLNLTKLYIRKDENINFAVKMHNSVILDCAPPPQLMCLKGEGSLTCWVWEGDKAYFEENK